MIVDYSECVVYQEKGYEQYRDKRYPPSIEESRISEEKRSDWFMQSSPHDSGKKIDSTIGNYYEQFYSSKRWCPTCSKSTLLVITEEHPFDLITGSEGHSLEIWFCQDCGWWNIKQEQTIPDRLMPAIIVDKLKQIRYGLLRSFDLSDENLPLQILERELFKNKSSLYAIHYKKFEELSGAILKDFYHCDVRFCGRTGDGGIDLFLIDKSKPIAVQVKRRTKPNSVEFVSPVRELLSSTRLSRAKSAIFVSSASRFSKGAEQVASQAVELKLVEKFELIDVNRFFDIFHITRSKSVMELNMSWIGYIVDVLGPYNSFRKAALEELLPTENISKYSHLFQLPRRKTHESYIRKIFNFFHKKIKKGI